VLLASAHDQSTGGLEMKGKVVVSLLAVLTLLGVSAKAQETSKIDVFAGYSYVRNNPATTGADSFNLNGGSANVAFNANRWLSGVADFGGYHAGNVLNSGVDGTLSTYLFGPRVSLRKYARFTPFAQALFGVAHASASIEGASGSANAFASAFGGGLDVNLSRHFAVRPFQVDYLLTRFKEATPDRQTQNNLRVSTGVVFRF
jgi:outer membrane immunogenic protein